MDREARDKDGKNSMGKWIVLAAVTACAAVSLALPGPLNLQRLIGSATATQASKPSLPKSTLPPEVAEAERNMLLAALSAGPLVAYQIHGGCLVALSGVGEPDGDEVEVWLAGSWRHIHLAPQAVYLQAPSEGTFDLIIRALSEGRHAGANVAILTANGRFVVPNMSTGNAMALPFTACRTDGDESYSRKNGS